MMDRRYMVKGRLGQVTTRTSLEMAVYTTGLPSWYLFCPMQQVSPGTFVQGTLAFSYHGKDLVAGLDTVIRAVEGPAGLVTTYKLVNGQLIGRTEGGI